MWCSGRWGAYEQTQEALAAASGVGVATIRRVESGTYEASILLAKGDGARPTIEKLDHSLNQSNADLVQPRRA